MSGGQPGDVGLREGHGDGGGIGVVEREGWLGALGDTGWGGRKSRVVRLKCGEIVRQEWKTGSREVRGDSSAVGGSCGAAEGGGWEAVRGTGGEVGGRMGSGIFTGGGRGGGRVLWDAGVRGMRGGVVGWGGPLGKEMRRLECDEGFAEGGGGQITARIPGCWDPC